MQLAYKQALDWYTELAKHAGWTDHARLMIEKMDKGQSGLFKGIQNDFETILAGQQANA